MIEIWVIYDHPLDFPDTYVARKFILDKSTDDIKTADSLDDLRKKLPLDLVRMDRNPKDDPIIIETWM